MQGVFRTSLLALLLMAQAAWAADSLDAVVADLRRHGYSQIDVSRTWLGRTRILATGPAGTREMILSRNSGEVLRDHLLSGADTQGGAQTGGDTGGDPAEAGGDGPGGPGGGGGDGGDGGGSGEGGGDD